MNVKKNIPTGDVYAAETEARELTGIVLPWNSHGKTSGGALRFSPKGTRMPKDLTSVKLLREHSPDGVPVGVMTEWENRPEGLWARFSVASTADGDRALVEAREHIRDRFSVEAVDITRTGPDVTDCRIKAVALVPYPAFESAVVDTVTASEHDEDDEPDDESEGADDDAENEESEDAEDDDTREDTTPMNKNTKTDAEKVGQGEKYPALLPQGMGAPAAPKEMNFSEVLDTIQAVRTGAKSASEIHAELTDITNSGMVGISAPAWLGELWSGVTYTRRIIPLITQAPLKSMKAQGYRWTTKPGVDKYTGDKTDIPSKNAAIEAVNVDAQRWAGGNDIDRKFYDFNDTEMLRAYWQAMAESYAFETDQEAGKFLVDNAKEISGEAPDIIRAVATAATTIDTDVYIPASFAIINPADLTRVLSLSQLDAPRYMDLTPVSSPDKWVTSKFVPAGTVVVGAKPAVTHFELAGSPLRVEAEHIAKGGRDAALFGYTALMLNRPEALRKISFTTS